MTELSDTGAMPGTDVIGQEIIGDVHVTVYRFTENGETAYSAYLQLGLVECKGVEIPATDLEDFGHAALVAHEIIRGVAGAQTMIETATKLRDLGVLS